MSKLKSSRARELVRQINSIDLRKVDYEYLRSLVGEFAQEFRSQAFTLSKEQRLYRGVVYSQKPTKASMLGAPPASLVSNFQRCNKPNSPMFYCSVDPAAVLNELGVKEGDIVYLSKWRVVDNGFLINPVICELEEKELYPALQIVYTFFETLFSQQIHDTFSHQYKITTAITELLTQGRVLVGDRKIKIGGILFPSVAHPNKSDNIALFPNISESCLLLENVEAVKITGIRDQLFDVEYLDFANEFPEGNIFWLGRPKKWKASEGNSITVTAEHDGWIFRDHNGNILNPS